MAALRVITVESPQVSGAEPINLMTVDKETPTEPGGDDFILAVDGLVTDFSVSLAGSGATIRVFRPNGENIQYQSEYGFTLECFFNF